jgi:cell division protein FtsI (penicillin-binding protein 3)
MKRLLEIISKTGIYRSTTSAQTGRFVLMAVCFAAAFAVVAGRLASFGFMATNGGDGLEALPVSTALHRPTMVDRKGRILATDIQAASLYADPQSITDLDDVVDQLSNVMPHLNTKALLRRLRGGGRFAWVERELSPRQQADIHELGLPGVAFVDEHHRVYPAGRTAAHVLGFVDIDNLGLAGMERYIDRSPNMMMVSSGARQASEPKIELSIDLGVQHALREELEDAIKRYQAQAAMGLVMDVMSGEVLAISSLPDFDPNQRSQAQDKGRFNRLTAGLFEMGSVFKIFTTAAALDLGVASMESKYDATEPIRIASFTIKDFHAQRRWLTVPEIFTYSSNIGTAKLALDIGIARHKQFLTKLGLLQRIETELGETAHPIVPANWKKINTMTIAFGHGLSVTPLHVAAGAAALMNGGYEVTPTFLKKKPGRVPYAERVVSERTSKQMRALMRLNVERGTARQADAKGFRVGGKTGTAEKVVNGRYSRDQLLTSFIGVFPADEPKYVILVMIDEPQRVEETQNRATAGVNAAPTARRFIERAATLLGVSHRSQTPQEFDELISASY